MSEELTPAPRTKHRPNEFLLPDDSREATALAIAVIRGENSYNSARALEGLSTRISKLVDADSNEALEELASHLTILETLFVRFSTDAMHFTSPSQKAILIRMAMAAQTNYSRTLALIAGLKLQRQGKAQVIVDDYERGDL